MRFAWLKSRRTNYALYLTAYVLIILAVLVAANVLANRYKQVLRRDVEQALYAVGPDHQGGAET